jgi:hypothetical protein
MGTNFYWTPEAAERLGLTPSERYPEDTYYRHLGKRSAAGLYCWDCAVTLCVQGESAIHFNHPTDDKWHPSCPRCGQNPAHMHPLGEGPAAVELGFAPPNTRRPTGVRGCSSFSWARNPGDLAAQAATLFQVGIKEGIEDEYGRHMDPRDFFQMVGANCPVQFYDTIGEEFS